MDYSTRPIVIHPGFHKTGTTTVQQTLRANRKALKPYAMLGLKWRFPDLIAASRGYSTYRDGFSLAKFSMRLDALLAQLPDYRHRALIMSCEELSGHIPGRAGLPDYSAAVDLMAEMAAAFRRRYGKPHLIFAFTTRKPESWLQSAYWEQVKSSSMVLDQDEYMEKFAAAANFATVLDGVARAVAPAPLHRFALEDCAAMRLGPAEPILRLAGLDDGALATMQPIAPANPRLAPEVLAHLLHLNRTIPDSDVRKAAKLAYLDEFRGKDDR